MYWIKLAGSHFAVAQNRILLVVFVVEDQQKFSKSNLGDLHLLTFAFGTHYFFFLALAVRPDILQHNPRYSVLRKVN